MSWPELVSLFFPSLPSFFLFHTFQLPSSPSLFLFNRHLSYRVFNVCSSRCYSRIRNLEERVMCVGHRCWEGATRVWLTTVSFGSRAGPFSLSRPHSEQSGPKSSFPGLQKRNSWNHFNFFSFCTQTYFPHTSQRCVFIFQMFNL